MQIRYPRPGALGRWALWAVMIAGSRPGTSQDEKVERARIDRYSSAAAHLSGLPFKHPVKVDRITKGQLRDFLTSELDRELPAEKVSQLQRGLAKFGLIPKDLDLRQAIVLLLGESVEAFYDPRSKALKIVQDGVTTSLESEALKALGIDLEGAVLVHELTHAAQDQAFDLSSLPLDEGNNDDLALALKSVIEGQASAVGWKYGLRERFDQTIGLIDHSYETAQLPGQAGRLPAYLRYTLTFPYGFGTEFVLEYMRRHGGTLPAISGLFKDFPLSSEQILHPEKYLGEKRDNPVLVTLPNVASLLGPAWKATLENVHGEYSISLILREQRGEGLDLDAIQRAAEGWGGDRYVLLEDGRGTVAYAWYSAWDSETDAEEFFEAYTLALRRKYGISKENVLPGNRRRMKTSEGMVQIERRGVDVLVLDGLPEELLGACQAIWTGVRKREMTSFERISTRTGSDSGSPGGRGTKTYRATP